MVSPLTDIVVETSVQTQYYDRKSTLNVALLYLVYWLAFCLCSLLYGGCKWMDNLDLWTR